MAGPGNHQFMLGAITKLTIARIGQNMKNMGQNLFTTYSPQRNVYRQTGTPGIIHEFLVRALFVFERDTENVIHNIPNLFFLQGCAERLHRRSFDS